jgi:hypothetical protein
MKFINTQAHTEWLPSPRCVLRLMTDVREAQQWLIQNYLEHIRAVPDDYPFFQPLSANSVGEWINGEFVVRQLTSEELEAIAAAQIEVPTFSPKQFIEFFTIEELRAIYQHAETVIDCRIWLDRLTGAAYVDLTDQALVVGMTYFVYQQIITQERFNEILRIG